MQDSKDLPIIGDHRAMDDQLDNSRDANRGGSPSVSGAAVASNGGGQSEVDGWQQYRRWISKAPAPRGRRSGIDPSLYTWKGYRNWTEQVKRNWSDN